MIQSQNELKDGNWSFWKHHKSIIKVSTQYIIFMSQTLAICDENWPKVKMLFTENIQKKEFVNESDLFDESGLNDSFTKGTDSSF